MNPRSILHLMQGFLKNHVGFVSGIILGLLSGLGIFGLGLGALVGYFADELLKDRKIRMRALQFLKDPRHGMLDNQWTKLTAAIGLACAAALEERGGTIGLADQELVMAKITSHLALSGRQSNLARIVIHQILSGASTEPARLAEFYRTISTEEERCNLLELVFKATMDAGGLPQTDQSNLIKIMSVDLGISSERYNAVRRKIIGIDLSPYEILGIPADAPDDEVRRVYHRLAAQFHPDTGPALEEHQLEQSKEAFMRIKNAYNRIIEEREAQR